MTVELGGVAVANLTDVRVRERTRLVRHAVPGLAGDIVQTLGRPSAEIGFAGICYGPDAPAQLARLRKAHLDAEPVDFVAEAVGDGFVTRVLIEALEVTQQAGDLDEFGFRCVVLEYVEPPAPPGDNPFAAIDDAIGANALSYVDDVQNALDQVDGLTRLVAAAPDFGDPTARLHDALDEFTTAVGDGPALLGSVRDNVTGAAATVPGTDAVTSSAAAAAGQAGELAAHLRGLAQGSPDSPLAPVSMALQSLAQKSDVDVSSLSVRLPAAVDAVGGVVQPANVEYVQSIGAAYTAAKSTVADHPLNAGIGMAGNVSAILTQVDGSFTDNLGAGLGKVLDRQAAGALTRTLGQMRDLHDSFPAHAGELMPFLADNLTGLPPDLLKPAADHVRTAVALNSTVQDPGAGAAQDALVAAHAKAAAALTGFDPASAASYTTLRSALDGVRTAATAVASGLTKAYGDLGAAVDTHDWNSVFGYGPLLDTAAASTGGVSTVTDLLNQISDVVSGISSGFDRVLDPEEMTRRGLMLADAIGSALSASPLATVRNILHGFVDELRRLLAEVPLEQVRSAVEDLLKQARSALETLGIDRVAAGVEAAFAELEALVDSVIGAQSVDQVRQAVAGLAGRLPQLPVKDLLAKLDFLATSAAQVVTSLADAATPQLDRLTALAAQLTSLNFTPLGDEVVGELGQLRAKLAAINPDALSAPERLAIAAALAGLRAIDLRGKVIAALKQGYAALDTQLGPALGVVQNVLGDLDGALANLDPDLLLKPVHSALGDAAEAVRGLSARTLVAPLRHQLDEITAVLAEARPGAVLDPLRGPYSVVSDAVGQLDPQVWLAPLGAVWHDVESALGKLDLRPVLDDLAARQDALVAKARDTIIAALDGLALPEPLATFVTGLRAAVAGMTGAILTDPGAALPAALLYQSAEQQVASLLKPLDDVYQRLIDLVRAAPQDAVVAAMNAVRTGIGSLDTVDPQSVLAQFRQARDELQRHDPAFYLEPVGATMSLRARFDALTANAPAERHDDVAATYTSFGAVAALVTPPADAVQAHEHLAAKLTQRVGALDASPLAGSYGKLHDGVLRLVPDFLRSKEPLTSESILAGLAALRPSALAAPLVRDTARLAQSFGNAQAAIQPVVTAIFAKIRDVLAAISPAVLKDALDEVYAAVQDRLSVLDPGGLAPTIRAQLFQPLADALAAVDPAKLRDRLDAAYTRALAKLTTGVNGLLDELATVLDPPLRQLAADVSALVTQVDADVTAAGKALTDTRDKLRGLDLVRLCGQLTQVLDNLRKNFDSELDRVARAFDQTLAAAPGGAHA
ncbi:hypothetical protein [Kutzneria sp. NPDC052558]|uniref:hypothetical protein n=1 Tax=Kutzneria sp. NPDC052558 TaxID=3364121 RepID=UPI0037C758E5